MELALYHPALGYYTRPRENDPFGKSGDFFTAPQLQPVFGRLIAAHAVTTGPDFIDLGAGRADMRTELERVGLRYAPILPGSAFPNTIHGTVFANEFFDALPVKLFRSNGREWREMLVAHASDTFQFIEGGPANQQALEYLDRHQWEPDEDGRLVELNLNARTWLQLVSASLTRGELIIIDYGYTLRERIRFPEGTLMSYRRHQATPNVLLHPGDQDITAHLDWAALESDALSAGFRKESFTSLAAFLLRLGESDQFASALAASSEQEAQKLRLQLKTLLFGMGESFQVLILSKRQP
jgi:SAM-dependent MidA family methyltransferase